MPGRRQLYNPELSDPPHRASVRLARPNVVVCAGFGVDSKIAGHSSRVQRLRHRMACSGSMTGVLGGRGWSDGRPLTGEVLLMPVADLLAEFGTLGDVDVASPVGQVDQDDDGHVQGGELVCVRDLPGAWPAYAKRWAITTPPARARTGRDRARSPCRSTTGNHCRARRRSSSCSAPRRRDQPAQRQPQRAPVRRGADLSLTQPMTRATSPVPCDPTRPLLPRPPRRYSPARRLRRPGQAGRRSVAADWPHVR